MRATMSVQRPRAEKTRVAFRAGVLLRILFRIARVIVVLFEFAELQVTGFALVYIQDVFRRFEIGNLPLQFGRFPVLQNVLLRLRGRFRVLLVRIVPEFLDLHHLSRVQATVFVCDVFLTQGVVFVRVGDVGHVAVFLFVFV